MANIQQAEAGSFYSYLSTGCKMCREGAKMVLYVTGRCGKNCFYCPLSEERRIDTVYANEKKVQCDDEVIEESMRMQAMGAGITGGEPLLEIKRVLYYIHLLKSTFGKKYHIHLYTALPVDEKTIDNLVEAGLDEIRFHPPLQEWGNIEKSKFKTAIINCKQSGLETGIEVPAIEGIGKFVDLCNTVDCFINFNELEFTETNYGQLHRRGYKLKDDISNAVAGSRDSAVKILKSFKRAHFCSSAYKDAIQLRKRLIRIAENTSRPFDEITDDGTIIFGIIHTKNTAKILEQLQEFEVPEEMYEIKENIIEIASWILEDIADDIRDVSDKLEIIERYPTSDGLIVESMPV
ncbi:radical SAM protein [Methanohalophilus mahii]|uniref:Radical SAM domain protein n=1 Tax=Methanohalophilus mahii (strain ATCC 35705 / DSM 5219 / SLP) TaxID=547558 RepID=D5EC39_METMS|nr:radical SAM protein [Methanohalophilus mahii]ADE36740.1 Radical SAM domain protein [Methanohalophilus mahii DSM 5219]